MSQANPYGITAAGPQNNYPPDIKTTAPAPTATTQSTLPDPPPENKRIRRYWDVICRVIVTLLLIGGIAAVIKIYEMKGALTRTQKYAYNTFTILLTLLLGINMTIAHSQFVLLIREGYVFTHPRDNHAYRPYRFDRKFHKINGLRSSLTFMLQEMRAKAYHGALRATSTFILVWFIFNLAVAIAIALIGLTYSLDEGGVGRRPGGMVSIVDTTHFYVDNNNLNTPDLLTERFVAKLYTDVSISYKNTSASEPGKADDHQLEELDDGWQYNFREMDPKETIVLRSDRYIKTSAKCQPLKIQDWNPTTLKLTYTDVDGSTQTIPILLIEDRTIYISRLYEDTNEIVRCVNNNPRCGGMAVAQLIFNDIKNSWLYYCDSMVEEVSHATLRQHQVSDEMALIAATSLSQSSLYDENNMSYGFYMNRVRWGETAGGDARKIEKMVSRASAGAIAAMDQLNPRVQVPGSEPWNGVHLKVRWARLIAVLVVIGLLQLIAAIATIIWHSKNLNPSSVDNQVGTAAPNSDPNAQPAAHMYPQQQPAFPPAPPQSPPPVYPDMNNGQYQYTYAQPQPGSHAHV